MPREALDVRAAGRERERARDFWRSLSAAQRWDIGDALVLGDLDLFRWFDGRRQSREFMNEIDAQRMLWESEAACA